MPNVTHQNEPTKELPPVWYSNTNGLMVQSSLPVDTTKLKDVTIIHDKEQAEKLFRERNGCDEDDWVNFTIVQYFDGVLHANSLNDFQYPINESIEEFINNYEL